MDKDFSVIGVVQTQNKHLCLLRKSYYKAGFPPTSQFLPELRGLFLLRLVETQLCPNLI